MVDRKAERSATEVSKKLADTAGKDLKVIDVADLFRSVDVDPENREGTNLRPGQELIASCVPVTLDRAALAVLARAELSHPVARSVGFTKSVSVTVCASNSRQLGHRLQCHSPLRRDSALALIPLPRYRRLLSTHLLSISVPREQIAPLPCFFEERPQHTSRGEDR